MKRLLTSVLIILGLMLGMGGLAGAQMVQELERSGLDHFGKAFYEAAPRKEHGKAEAEYRLAEEAFQKAIRSKPDWVAPYLHLGRTYFVQQKYRLAAEVYRKALTLVPQPERSLLAVGLSIGNGRGLSGAVSVLQDFHAQGEPTALSISILDDFIEPDSGSSRSRAAPKARKAANSRGWMPEVFFTSGDCLLAGVSQFPCLRRSRGLLLSDCRPSFLVYDPVRHPHWRQEQHIPTHQLSQLGRDEPRQVITPQFIVNTGDLTDCTNGGIIPNGPYQAEWDTYRQILESAGITPDFYYDMPQATMTV